MRRLYSVALVLVATGLLLGAKGCTDCQKKQAEAMATCQALGSESDACKRAEAEAEKTCTANPQPTPTPVAPPPGDVCLDGQYCNCYHNPTGDKWILAACGVGQQCDTVKQCVAVPTPPPPTPPPTTACAVESNLEVTSPQLAPQLSAIVRAEIETMGDTAGQPPALTLERLAGQLRAKGLCAIAGVEAVFVQRTDKYFEEYHAVFFGTGALIPSGKFVGTHFDKAGGVQPPQAACTSPQPPKVDRFNLKAHGRVNDSTSLYYNRTATRWDGSVIEGFCDQIGFSNRLHCPARMECEEGRNNFKCGEREACEAIGTSGSYEGKQVWRSDGVVNLTDNPAQATCSRCTWLETCAADGTNCTRCSINPGTGLCNE